MFQSTPGRTPYSEPVVSFTTFPASFMMVRRAGAWSNASSMAPATDRPRACRKGDSSGQAGFLRM